MKIHSLRTFDLKGKGIFGARRVTIFTPWQYCTIFKSLNFGHYTFCKYI